jgi:hypothetical protein
MDEFIKRKKIEPDRMSASRERRIFGKMKRRSGWNRKISRIPDRDW